MSNTHATLSATHSSLHGILLQALTQLGLSSNMQKKQQQYDIVVNNNKICMFILKWLLYTIFDVHFIAIRNWISRNLMFLFKIFISWDLTIGYNKVTSILSKYSRYNVSWPYHTGVFHLCILFIPRFLNSF